MNVFKAASDVDFVFFPSSPKLKNMKTKQHKHVFGSLFHLEFRTQ